ncbi:hypothetical protein ACH5RR_020117, partial [Cinchona calisaya]
GLLNWSLISFFTLVASLIIRFAAPKRGFRFRCRNLLLWCIFVFSLVAIFSQVIFLITWAIMGSEWTVADAWWVKLIGLMKVQSWRSPVVIYLLVIQLLVAVVALTEIQWNRFGSRLRVASCLLLPGIQLVVGISNPSWLSLPFFVCSCVGLVDWSLTSNFLGIFRLFGKKRFLDMCVEGVKLALPPHCNSEKSFLKYIRNRDPLKIGFPGIRGMRFAQQLLHHDIDKRLSAEKALRHPYLN